MKPIDNFLNKITMYRLVVYGLGLLVAAGVFLAGINKLALDGGQMAASFVLLLGSGYLTELVLSKIWRTPYNQESWLITGLILFLIIRPPHNLGEAAVAVAAGIVATASKYILAWHGRHIFNPAALAAAFLSLSALQTTTWWVGSSTMWPLVLIVGLAIVRKIRRFQLVLTFVVVSLGTQALLMWAAHQPIGLGIKSAIVASPLIFLSTIMLTEPATLPGRRYHQFIFAALVGLLYAESWKVGPIYFYPEVALLAGNLFAFSVSPKYKIRMVLKEIQTVSDQVRSYVFQPETKLAFLPGQYMEWTLPGVLFDARGNRRTFTIASSPTENEIRLGVKFYNPSSAFKRAMSQMKPGDFIYASQLAGHFTLDQSEQKKLAFIAGGIGITPFRSMIKYITDRQLKCDITLLYIVSKPEELAYKKELLAAKDLGVRLIPVLSSDQTTQVPGMLSAKLSSDLIRQAVPDFAERLFYVSGPDAMVSSAKQLLRSMNIASRNIKTDYFSGY